MLLISKDSNRLTPHKSISNSFPRDLVTTPANFQTAFAIGVQRGAIAGLFTELVIEADRSLIRVQMWLRLVVFDQSNFAEAARWAVYKGRVFRSADMKLAARIGAQIDGSAWRDLGGFSVYQLQRSELGDILRRSGWREALKLLSSAARKGLADFFDGGVALPSFQNPT